MGTWLHGWIEVKYVFDESSWRPLLQTDDLLGLKAWWRISLFGHSRVLDGYFDPLPFENGVPDDLSDTVRFDATGRHVEADTYTIEPLDDHFYEPERDAQYITYERLKAIDWDEPRNDLTAELEDLDEWALENELLMHAYEFELRDATGNVLEERARNVSRESELATIVRTTEWNEDLLERCVTDVPGALLAEDGPLPVEDGFLHAVKSMRRDFVPNGWFSMLKLMAQLTESASISDEDVRLFCYFTY